MRILLIEDSARLRELLCEAIRDEGWKIDAFETAQEGRLALREGEYDLLLLDLGLPDEDGIDLLKSLRDAGTQTPVLVLTARGAIDERISGLDAGADDYLTKPFHNGELTARIRALAETASVLLNDLAGRRAIVDFDPIPRPTTSAEEAAERRRRNNAKRVARGREPSRPRSDKQLANQDSDREKTERFNLHLETVASTCVLQEAWQIMRYPPSTAPWPRSSGRPRSQERPRRGCVLIYG